jgi:hypothetical protein
MLHAIYSEPPVILQASHGISARSSGQNWLWFRISKHFEHGEKPWWKTMVKKHCSAVTDAQDPGSRAKASHQHLVGPAVALTPPRSQI